MKMKFRAYNIHNRLASPPIDVPNEMMLVLRLIFSSLRSRNFLFDSKLKKERKKIEKRVNIRST